jgi:nucleotide-binding universal stress UspA family protein
VLVVNAQLGGYGRIGAEPMWAKADLDTLLSSAVATVRAQGGEDVDTAVIGGYEPADAIAEYAKLNDFSHIVLGTGGKGSLARMMLGSVANGVLVKASCTVSVAR